MRVPQRMKAGIHTEQAWTLHPKNPPTAELHPYRYQPQVRLG